jgi:pimeloyl-ACP methyl ester carboxylesterase
MKSIFLTTNGVRLHAMADGPADGKLVVLLHGFPDFWYGWRHQIPVLAAASDKPKGVANYKPSVLAADIAGVIEKESPSGAYVVGHDWGGAITWSLGITRPDLVRKFVVINCPHPKALPARLVRDPGQFLRSWYVFFFQLPFLPEAAIRANSFLAPSRGFKTAARGTFTSEDFQKYREAWEQPGALTAMLNWYRAAFRPDKRPAKRGGPAPGMLVWGTGDAFLKEELADDSVRLQAGVRLEKVSAASHWLPAERAETLNSLLLEYFR